MDMYRVTCIVQCLRALRGCTVHGLLYCWIHTVYVWLSTAMGMEVEQCHIWLLHAQFLRPCLMPHMTGENGSLDMWLFLVHEYSLYFCYEFCCLHIYPVYFHHYLHISLTSLLSIEDQYHQYFHTTLHILYTTYLLGPDLIRKKSCCHKDISKTEYFRTVPSKEVSSAEQYWDRQNVAQGNLFCFKEREAFRHMYSRHSKGKAGRNFDGDHDWQATEKQRTQIHL